MPLVLYSESERPLSITKPNDLTSIDRSDSNLANVCSCNLKCTVIMVYNYNRRTLLHNIW